MTKSEFVNYIAENYNTTKKNAGEIVDTFASAFMSATKDFGMVNLVGFMKSEVVDVPEKERRNPATGKTFTAPAHKAVKIKIAKRFKLMEE